MMARRTVAALLLPAFGAFCMSCASTQIKGPSEIADFSARTAIVAVVTKAGETIEFRKDSPGRVVPGGSGVAGRALKQIDLDQADVEKVVRDAKQKPVGLVAKDGVYYQLVAYEESDAAVRIRAYAPVTVPLADIQQVWVRKTDAGRSFILGAALVAGAIAVVGIVAIAQAEHDLEEGSCPFVYSWTGEEFALDAEPYGGAISAGLKRTDWIELSELRADGGTYRLLLANELDETDHTDELKLVAVDHAPGVKIAPDLGGRWHTFTAPRPPRSAVDQTGRDILPFVKANDRAFWLSDLAGRDPDGEGEFRDELLFEFPKPAGAKTAKLLANVWTTRWGSLSSGMFLEHYGTALPGKYAEVDRHGPMYAQFMNWVASEELAALKVWVETPAGWTARAMILGGAPVVTKDKAYLFSVGDIPGETLRIKLRPPVNFWMVNALAVDYGEDQATEATELAAVRAVDRAGRDYRTELEATDGVCLVSPAKGERTELVFEAPPLKPGLERTMFVKASGYYKTHIDATGEPRLDLAERILTEPGFAARYSFREYLKWEAGLRAEAQKLGR